MIIVSRLSRFYNHWKPKSKPKLKFDSSHIPTAVELFFYCITTHERHMIQFGQLAQSSSRQSLLYFNIIMRT